jgi:hypothetical protein
VPRLVKGGKWAYGWVRISARGRLLLPPDARADYAFREGDGVVFLAGSRASGGFAIARTATLPHILRGRALGQGRVSRGFVVAVPPSLGAPGRRLLAVRGSGRGLGLVAQGRIYTEALRHPELERYDVSGEGTEAPPP